LRQAEIGNTYGPKGNGIKTSDSFHLRAPVSTNYNKMPAGTKQTM